MLFALEGITAVGKSSVARVLESDGLLVYADAVRHGLLGPLSAREMWIAGNQCNLSLAALAALGDYVADRWCLSSFVYDTWRAGGDTDELRYETLLPLYAAAPARVYLLRAPAHLAYTRMLKRAVGPSYSLQDLEQLDRRFLSAVSLWNNFGGDIVVVDSSDVEVAMEFIRKDVADARRR